MRSDETLNFPVSVDVPAKLHTVGRNWFRRPEFHVTTCSPDALADAFGVDPDALWSCAEQHGEQLTQRRRVRFDGRIALVDTGDGRATLVAFCDVDDLDDVYRAISAAVGRHIPPPPTHVTLYTSEPGMVGIGLATAADVDAYTTLLTDDDAATVRRYLLG